MNSQAQADRDQGCYLPNFCISENFLILILVIELIAIVLALNSIPQSGLYVHIALISMYMQWIALSCAGVMCMLKKWLFFQQHLQATLSSLTIVVVITMIMATVAYTTNGLFRFDYFEGQSLVVVMLKHVASSLILTGLALRYFYVQYNHRQMIQAKSSARLQALQARIRPHFLFNSLNTIASLTHTDPDVAENAIENLSDLFRASLNAHASINLKDEISLTCAYIELEKLRLGDRLKVTWTVKANVNEINLPALTLQPLVENAIYHGIEPLENGGKVEIRIHQSGDLSIEIINPLNPASSQSHSKGNQMALDNIAERLQIAFQGKAKIEHIAENHLYKVTIKMPVYL